MTGAAQRIDPPLRAIRGVVLDEDGHEVADCEVILRHLGEHVGTRTDEAGRFAFAAVPPARYALSANEGALGWIQAGAAQHAVDPEVVLSTRGGAQLLLHVTGEGQPVTGAVVALAGVDLATTDEDGLGRVAGLGPGMHACEVRARGWALLQTMLFVGVDGRTNIELRIELERALASDGEPPGAELSGCVSSDEAATVAGARVELRGPRDYSVLTGADGSFRVAAPETGVYEVVAYTWAQASAPTSVEVRPGGSAFARLVLDWGSFLPRSTPRWPSRRWTATGTRARESEGSITGVVTRAGQPMTAFWLAANRVDRTSVDGTSQVPITEVTNAAGAFTLPHLAAGRWTLAIVSAHTRPLRLPDVVVVASETSNVGVLAVEGGVPVSGEVHDATGAAVPDARVIINEGYEGRARVEAWLASAYETRTDAHGRFAFDAVNVTEDQLRRIRATHATLGDSAIHALTAKADGVRLVLERAGDIQGGVAGAYSGPDAESGPGVERRPIIEGRPFIITGTPVSVTATAPHEPPDARRIVVGPRGEFRFRSVPAGTYLIALDLAHPVAPTEVRVEPGQVTHVALAMPSTVSLEVRLVTSASTRARLAPIADGAPAITRAVRPASTLRFEDEVRFSFNRVQPGPYAVSFDEGPWRTLTVSAAPAKQAVTWADERGGG